MDSRHSPLASLAHEVGNDDLHWTLQPITNVDTSDANLMDLIGDAATGPLTGQIRWPTTGNPVTVKYKIVLGSPTLC